MRASAIGVFPQHAKDFEMKKMTMAGALVTAMVAGQALGAPTADQQKLRINEILINPSGGGSNDDRWEYIEVYGCPNTPLNGLALVIVNDPSSASNDSEIDEAIYIPAAGGGVPTYQTNSSGYFVFWNTNTTSNNLITQVQNSDVYMELPANTMRQTDEDGDLLDLSGDDITDLTTRYECGMRERDNGDDGAKIANDGSLTVMLIGFTGNTGSSYLEPSDVEKDDDVSDGDAVLNLPSAAAWTDGSGFYLIDEIAYSDDGGSEFTFSEANEIDFTPSFKPDALSRCDDVAEATYTDRWLELEWDEDEDGVCGEQGSPTDIGTDGFRSAYQDWVFGDVNGSLEFVYGAGDAALPSSSGATTQVLCSAIDAYGLTPGSANEAGQISASCASPLAGEDLDGDGAVTVNDLILAAALNDTRAVLRVVRSLR